MNIVNRTSPRPEPFATYAQSENAQMTADQANLLRTLCQEADLPFPGQLTQLEAHEHILALQDLLRTKT